MFRTFWPYIIFVFLLGACKDQVQVDESKLVSTDFVQEHIGHSGYKIIDARNFDDYQKGHIPGALHWSADEWIGDDCILSYDIPDKESLDLMLKDLGVQEGDKLLVYDDLGGCKATKIWWMLKNHGYENVSIINGGINKWKDEKANLDLPSNALEKSEIEIRREAELMTYAADLLYIKEQRSNQNLKFVTCQKMTLDSLTDESMVHLDLNELFSDSVSKELKDVLSLDEYYTSMGLDRENEIIICCSEYNQGALIQFILQEVLKYPKVRQFSGDSRDVLNVIKS